MPNPKNFQNSLSFLKKNWCVAELEISFKKKHKTNVIINDTEKAANAFRAMWDDSLLAVQEQFCAMFINSSNEVIGFRVINTGSVNRVNVDVSLVIASALKCRSYQVVVAHNHPSGKCLPSNEDIRLTNTIKDRLRFFDIELLDHIVLTEDQYYSLADNGFFN